MFSLVMFDLDGTLLDTAPGLAAAVNAALAKSGLRAVDEAQARCWIGKGMRELMLRAHCRATGGAGGARRNGRRLRRSMTSTKKRV